MTRRVKIEGMRLRAVAAVLFAGLSLSACAFDPEPPIGYGDPQPRQSARQQTGTYFTVTVRGGDTLSGIAARYNVSVHEIMRANRTRDQDRIYAGESLRIPGEYRRARAAAPRQTARPSHRPAPRENENETMLARAQAVIDRFGSDGTAAPTREENDFAAYQTPTTTVRTGGTGQFAWPISGRVIAPFGTSASGERNDGINIAARQGAPIHAAASGTVTYSGNQLKGYGNLALIKHDNGYVTAYAHADRMVVARGDQVTKGQVIGYAGQTGNVSEPQVHFEIRHNTKPVDPNPLLVASR